MKIDNEGRF